MEHSDRFWYSINMNTNANPYTKPDFGLRLKRWGNIIRFHNKIGWHVKYNEWYSSAQKMDDLLEKHGVNIGKKLFHKYNMPKGLSQKWYDEDFRHFSQKFDKDEKNRHLYEVRMNEIKKLNPELSLIEPKSVWDITYFIAGAIYGFSPQEINYHVSGKAKTDGENEKVKQFRKAQINVIKSKTGGLYPTYCLSPENLDAIVNAI